MENTYEYEWIILILSNRRILSLYWFMYTIE